MAKESNILIIVGIFILFVFLIQISPKLPLSILSDKETDLKSKYTTYWADATDGYLDTAYTKYDEYITPNYFYSNDKFTCEILGNGRASMGDTSNKGGVNSYYSIYTQGNDGNVQCKTKKDFKGQEVVVLLSSVNENSLVNGLSFSPGLIIFKPRTLTPNIYDIHKDFEGNIVYSGIDYSKGLFITFGGSGGMTIDYIGSKALFSCDLSKDEVWIQENFAQPFNIKDLEFEPTKFCKETRPFVLRDILQGETPIYPNPIPSFNTGETLLIPNGKIGVINYATYFVEGVNNKCAPNEANIKIAGKWVCSQVIKPIEVTLQCKVDSDCYVPQKQQCFGYFKGCQNNKCMYDETIPNSPTCKNEIVTIVKQIQQIENRTIIAVTGNNVFTFSQNKDRNSFNIGDKTFLATMPKFSCSSTNDIINAPSPSSDCWKTTINYNGKDFELKDTQSIFIHPLIKVQYFASGTYVLNPEFKRPTDKTNFRDDNWGNTFVFTLDTLNALDMNIEDSSFVLKDSNKKVKLFLTNNLPNGKGIVKIYQKIKNINLNLPEQTIEKVLKKGENILEFNINTTNLGINSLSIQLFYVIEADSKVLIPSDKFTLNYDVVDKIPEKIIEVEKIIEKPVFIEKENIIEVSKPIPLYIKLIIGFFIIFIVLSWL